MESAYSCPCLMLFKQLSRNHKIKMSSKVNTLCLIIVALLFFFTLTSAARPHPAFPDSSLTKNLHGEVEVEAEKVEESCEGVGEEECLMRRTLAAHIDYIYTQKTKP
ncbi:hypothetical protein Patl1_37330 [Pistacia atlantica]|nr:hypothetical protein Patl1_37330 [Pistacia atlantica]